VRVCVCVCVWERECERECNHLQEHVWSAYETGLPHMCAMTHSYAWHDAYTCITQLKHLCGANQSCVWHHSLMCVCVGVHACVCVWERVYSFMLHESIMCVMWLMDTCDSLMTRSHVWHDSVLCAPWTLNKCGTGSNASSRGSTSCLICVNHFSRVIWLPE